MELQTPDDEVITRLATAHLADLLPDEIDVDAIEATVRDQVRTLRSTARVQAFVGIIAERKTRELLTQGGARR
jgi:hypothetical protein